MKITENAFRKVIRAHVVALINVLSITKVLGYQTEGFLGVFNLFMDGFGFQSVANSQSR